ncbi:MAG: SDR family NAD(P)-dependent oxidoreductase, partial [Chitinivibrionales bacterium]|nr:SDR family NAD(P)-dependent oxidoreductase [Chitinivibrionales bacterium]
MAPSSNADRLLDAELDNLRSQGLFNDDGNFQFKNKFRTENISIYLSRGDGKSNPDNIVDIIMMIADPLKMQTPDEAHHTSEERIQLIWERDNMSGATVQPSRKTTENRNEPNEMAESAKVIDGEVRSYYLAKYRYNPMNIPDSLIAFDLKTDSWAQLRTPFIEKNMCRLHGGLQYPINPEECVRELFPFNYVLFTAAGRDAENAFCKGFGGSGIVIQNLLFPTGLYHQIDKGFSPIELPDPMQYSLQSTEYFRGGLNLEEVRDIIERDRDSISFVWLEVDNNGAGGYPVSMKQLKGLKTLVGKHRIPLVIDATRVIENAHFIVKHEDGYAGKSAWHVAREILACADAVTASLTKDFCVKTGGCIATNDNALYKSIHECINREGLGIDIIDKKLIGLSFREHSRIENLTSRRINSASALWNALRSRGVPVLEPAGGHCVVIDVKRMHPFSSFADPVSSCAAWLFITTGVRAGAHSVGMQKNTALNNLLRLAIPVGLSREDIDEIATRMIAAFERMENIPELTSSAGVANAVDVHGEYILHAYHNTTGPVVAASAVSIPEAVSDDSTKEKTENVSAVRIPTSENVSANPTKDQSYTSEIAVVGMAGRYPKARNLDELWDNILNGRDCIETIPDERFHKRQHCEFSKKYRGGFIDDIDKFDSLFFNISPREAEMLDPQERLFLEVAWEAIEDAGYYPDLLSKEAGHEKVGVYVGAVWTLYQMIGIEEKLHGHKVSPNSFLWSIANRVSYWMNLSGPSMTVDTACSSSLTALYLACEAIKRGECTSAIVGGVNLDIHQSKWDINWAEGAGALSEDGVCRTFGKGANGYVPGEGVGALFLKPVESAVRDKDNIYGIIKGIAVNHGGKTSGFMVPDPHAQARLVESALRNAGIDARTITYIEAHGTGTELGDPIEISGLNKAFKKYDVERNSCSIGSVKTNIGHLEAGAGIVGVQKVLLQMDRRTLVPSLHSQELNEYIEFENSPFFVQQKVEDWEPKYVNGQKTPLRAGISSFGAGGSNAHVIIEKYESAPNATDKENEKNVKFIFPFSARDENQLRESAKRILFVLERDLTGSYTAAEKKIRDISFTLCAGRKSFGNRLAIIAKTKKELAEKISAFLDGKSREDVFQGEIKKSNAIAGILNRNETDEFIRLVLESREPSKIAHLWVEGLFNDWQEYVNNGGGKRISLPTYPFDGKSYWISRYAPGMVIRLNGMHPLLHTNTSDLGGQSYQSTFSGSELLISGRKICGRKVMAIGAYLEMARTAIDKATLLKEKAAVLELWNVGWECPLVFHDTNDETNRTLISIALCAKDNERIEFEITKNAPKDTNAEFDRDDIVHCKGEAVFRVRHDGANVDLVKLENELEPHAFGSDIDCLYEDFATSGIQYGTAFRLLTDIRAGSDKLLARLRIPEKDLDTLSLFYVHPGLVEGAIHAAVVLLERKELVVGKLIQPVAMESVVISASCRKVMFALVQNARVGTRDEKSALCDVVLCDDCGTVCVELNGIEFSYINKALVEKSSKEFGGIKVEDGWDGKSYLPEWVEAPIVDKNDNHEHKSVVIVCCDSSRDFESDIKQFYHKTTTALVTIIRLGNTTRKISENEWLCGVNDPKGFETCLGSVKIIDALYVICMGEEQFDSVAIADVMDGYRRNEIQFLRLAQYLKNDQKVGNAVDTYVLSLDNFACGDVPNNYRGAGVTGLAYSLAHRNFRYKVRNCDFSRKDLANSDQRDILLNALVNEPASDRGELIKFSDGQRYRMAFTRLEWAENDDTVIKQDGVYVILGGSGTVGQIFTRNLIERYNATVVWIGRSAKDSDKVRSMLASWECAERKLFYVQGDALHLTSMEKAVKDIKNAHGSIAGAFFAGLVFGSDDAVEKINEKKFEEIVSVKIRGSLTFYKALKDEKLDFICYFSSGQAWAFTGAGQVAAYACGITFADSLVQSLRKSAHFPVGIINWGFWGATIKKMITETSGKTKVNYAALEDNEGFECFVRFVGELQRGRINQVLCMKAPAQIESLMPCDITERIDLAHCKEGLKENGKNRTSLRRKKIDNAIAPSEGKIKKEQTLDRKQSSSTMQVASPVTESNKRALVKAQAKPAIPLQGYVENVIHECLSAALKMPKESIDPDTAFFEYGLDSMLGVAFIDDVNEKLSISMNAAITFEFFTVANLAGHVISTYGENIQPVAEIIWKKSGGAFADKVAEKNEEEVRNLEVTPERIALTELIPKHTHGRNKRLEFGDGKKAEIAVIGMAGQFPKAKTIHEFWSNLLMEVDGVDELPPHYLDPRIYTTEKQRGKTRCKWGGIVEDRDCFDPMFFKITPREAESMNPHQRLVLQEGWKAIEDAGYNPRELQGTKTGVFIGAEPINYHGESFTGSSDAIIASRLSYVLNLNGPALVIDTACSASAVAIHLACESLRNHETDSVLAGGVNACMNQNVQIALDDIEMISPTGRCNTFDGNGDGTIISEGIGMVYLKRLEDAIQAGDPIYGIINASGVNQDGASNGITAPNGVAQEQLITSVYEKYNIDPEKIGYVEAHGTGTILGDPVEANALIRAFKKFTDKRHYCSIGSAKSHIGHTAAAAGVIGLIKVLLTMRHKRIPRLLHFNNLNPLIDLKKSPFYISTGICEWESPKGECRMAALNSFGHGGTNAHIVLREYIPTRERKKNSAADNGSRECIIPLSAKTPEQLREKAIDLLNFIEKHCSGEDKTKSSEPVRLNELAYTLQIGREEMDERLGFVVGSLDELAKKLKEYVNGKTDIDNCYIGAAKRCKESMSFFDEEEAAAEIINNWILHGRNAKLLEAWVRGCNLDWKMLYSGEKPEKVNLPPYPFARERYWLDSINGERVTIEEQAPTISPVLHRNISNLSRQAYSSTFIGSEFFLKDHQINKKRILPASVYFEIALAAIIDAAPPERDMQNIELRDIHWICPIVVEQEDGVTITIALYECKYGSIEFEISSDALGQDLVHCSGKAKYNDDGVTGKLDLHALRARMSAGCNPNDFYNNFIASGIEYGDSLQGVIEIARAEKQALMRVGTPDAIANNSDNFLLHPTYAEASLQSALYLRREYNNLNAVPLSPVHAERVRVYKPCTNEMYASIRINDDDEEKIDCNLCDAEGNLSAVVQGLSIDSMEEYNLDVREKSDSRDEAATIREKEIVPTSEEQTERMFFVEEWQEEQIADNEVSGDKQQYIIFADKNFHAGSMNGKSKEAFADAVYIYRGQTYKKESKYTYQCRDNTEDDIRMVLNAEALKKEKAATIVYAWAQGKGEAGIHALFGLFRAVHECSHPISRIVLIGRYDPTLCETCWDYSWIGFERSLKLAMPKVVISLLYTDTGGYTSEQIDDAAKRGGAIWYAKNRRYKCAIVSKHLAEKKKTVLVKQNGAYVVTGGCGALGKRFAEYLAETCNARLILLGRRKITSEIRKKIDELYQAGAHDVRYYSVDVSKRESVEAWAGNLPYRLSGIFHIAGVESSRPFYEKDIEEIKRVLYPKTIGTLLLDEYLSEHRLDFVCYFSSSSAILGDTGACDYAIANRFLMAFSHYRQAVKENKGRSIAVNWPLFSDGGMATEDPGKIAFYLKSSGQE